MLCLIGTEIVADTGMSPTQRFDYSLELNVTTKTLLMQGVRCGGYKQKAMICERQYC